MNKLENSHPLDESGNSNYKMAVWEQTAVKVVLKLSAVISVFVTAAILVILISETLGFFKEISVREFFLGTKWTPLFEPRHFGVLPIVWGTLLVSIGACFVSVPLGLAVAFYLSEYASTRTRKIVKPMVEILAGIPSVVFGYFALIVITPFIRTFIPEAEVFNALSASIVVGIMTLPLVSSLSDDAFRAVPRSLKEAGYALGATKLEVCYKVILPAAASGVVASVILAFSRAIGETMAVTLAAGATPKLTLNFLESIQTMTAYVVQVSMGDTPHGTIEYQSLFAVAFVLFAITLVVNMIAQWVVKKTMRNYQ
jgi:phosphate transport system permease protein